MPPSLEKGKAVIDVAALTTLQPTANSSMLNATPGERRDTLLLHADPDLSIKLSSLNPSSKVPHKSHRRGIIVAPTASRMKFQHLIRKLAVVMNITCMNWVNNLPTQSKWKC
jgi:hypothetical protein